ncbi:hypothetical protein N0824_00559 [Microcystis sp. 0824]|uniref:Uncharacterized protein n=2 Tax=Microcystis aeruginosa TaxID=1126 RepID=L7E531_MICAE|nr:hypothetical protein O53_2792 [Microcystis aeruginosa TAIHU98]ODV37121.1 hypothetical protein BFG60_3439 [Microcystis aeruginosa NIES-98]GBF52710.1 hypothetical protein N0824_00559 [Microcystis sp. 0824]GCE61877.1 hypothetical protein MiAbB_03820 [Microcystis aeruginosa NIES-4285]CCI08020.1 hypothetical protein MICAD_2940019 [Microcystis aeruginosa PCC 7941]
MMLGLSFFPQHLEQKYYSLELSTTIACFWVAFSRILGSAADTVR